jgi:predicted small lipoprotein YifL
VTPPRMAGRALYLALVLTLVAAPLAGCGKKGQPGLPNGEKSAYPLPYPRGATQNATPTLPGAAPAPNPDEPIPAVPPSTIPPGAVPTGPQSQNVPTEE